MNLAGVPVRQPILPGAGAAELTLSGLGWQLVPGALVENCLLYTSDAADE